MRQIPLSVMGGHYLDGVRSTESVINIPADDLEPGDTIRVRARWDRHAGITLEHEIVKQNTKQETK